MRTHWEKVVVPRSIQPPDYLDELVLTRAAPILEMSAHENEPQPVSAPERLVYAAGIAVYSLQLVHAVVRLVFRAMTG